MSNVRLITPNYADDATITSSPAMVSTLPITNLQDSLRGRVARSTSLATQTYLFDWSSAINVNALTIERHNYSPAATIRYRLWDGAAQSGTLLYDSTAFSNGTTIPWGTLRWGIDSFGGTNIFIGWAYAWTKLYHDSAISARSGSIVITDAANPDGYMQASRLRIGRYFEPVVGIAQGDFTPSWRESTTQQRTAGGSLRSDNLNPYRRFAFALRNLASAEMDELFEISRVVGLRKDLFVDIMPGVGGRRERNFSGPVKFVQPLDFPNVRFDTYQTEIVVEES